MLTLIAGSLLFIATSYVGIQIKKYYKCRKNYLANLIEFAEIAEGKISYLKTPIKDILHAFSESKKGEIERVMLKLIEYFDGKIDNKKELYSRYLKQEENDYVVSFLINMGSSNLNNELVKIKAFKIQTEQYYKSSKEQYEKNGTLAYKLGVLFGIALMLIVV